MKDTTQLKQYLPQYVEMITQKSKGNHMYICPFCHSGTGKNKTGAFSINDDELHWKCFKCGLGGDLFTLIGKYENLPTYAEQQTRIQELFESAPLPYPKKKKKPAEKDYTEFFAKAHQNIYKTNYPALRGLGSDIIQRFQLGYIEKWTHPKAPHAPASPRLIIPTSKTSYLARDTRTEIPPEQRSYSKSKVGTLVIFNQQVLANATQPIFVVEGEIDALSIMEVGGEAVALGTVVKVKAFLALLQIEKPAQPFILSLDNDTAGQKASTELQQGLDALAIAYFVANVAGSYKDANDALQQNRQEFANLVEQAKNLPKEIEQAQKQAYLGCATANYIESFLEQILANEQKEVMRTGFTGLDTALDGGLYEGLYIIGAISSLGKTTLVTQIADQIAQQGQDVLIFSLEMARDEIMAKSISRHTLLLELEQKGVSGNAKTARGITTGKRYASYNANEKALISHAVEEYKGYAGNIYISEGIGDIGVMKVREVVQQHIAYTGKTPLVIIDYIQILAPYNERATDKQNTDKAVLELKRISRDFKLPLIGISSFNRASYKEAVTMEAFKESGAIEYSSDVLIGLQLKGAGQKDFDATYAKQRNPREVELVVLKSRNSKVGERVYFKYYPLFNYFEEDTE